MGKKKRRTGPRTISVRPELLQTLCTASEGTVLVGPELQKVYQLQPGERVTVSSEKSALTAEAEVAEQEGNLLLCRVGS